MAIRASIVEALGLVEIWNEVQQSFQNLSEITLQHHGNLDELDAEDWPDNYIDGLFDLMTTLTKCSRALRRMLANMLVSTPIWELFEDNLVHRDSMIMYIIPKSIHPNEPMPALLSFLTMHNPEKVFPLHQIMEQLERILATDACQRARIKPMVWKLLTDVQVIEEFSRQLRRYCPKLYFPACQSSPKFDTHKRPRVIPEDCQIAAKANKLYDVMTTFDWSEMGTPTHENFYYPADEPRTERNTTQMQKAAKKAAKRFDLLWGKLDDLMKRQYDGITISDVFATANFPSLNLQRTKDWSAPVKLISSVKPEPVLALVPLLEYDSHSTAPPAFDREAVLSPRSKIKTRGFGSDSLDSILATKADTKDRVYSSVDESLRSSRHPIKLKDRDLKVFQALFYQPCQTAAPGLVKWCNFIHAMTSIGFSYQSLGGSATQFVPSAGLGLDRGISFHEPHPESKIPFFMARAMGRRLQSVYGWGRESFAAK